MKQFTLSSLFLCIWCFALFPGCAKTSDDFLRSGLSHVEHRRYKEALSDFNASIGLDSGNARAYLERAKIACQTGFTEPVQADLTKYIELSAHHLAVAYIGRALTYRLQRNFQASLDDLDKAINIYPADISGFVYKEDILNEIGDSLHLKEFRHNLDEQTRFGMQSFRDQPPP